MYALMILCAFLWGSLSHQFIQNAWVSLPVAMIGGFAIGFMFQTAGLL